MLLLVFCPKQGVFGIELIAWDCSQSSRRIRNWDEVFVCFLSRVFQDERTLIKFLGITRAKEKKEKENC